MVKHIEAQFWLTALFEDANPCWPPNIEACKISIDSATTLQEICHNVPFRTSPIFPISSDFVKPKADSYYLYFYCFNKAFTILAKLQNVGSKKLLRHLWYTFGLASILLITENPELHREVLKLTQDIHKDYEIWQIKNSRIAHVTTQVNNKKPYDPKVLKILDYSGVPVAERVIIDELVSNITLIVPKIATHIPSELESFPRLVAQMNELIAELVYLSNPNDSPPATLAEHSKEDLLRDPFLRDRIKHGITDRLIQVNSAMSYISTQMLSGAIPIMERRSLIRRHSLLGIGSAILGLIGITRSIELAFSQSSIEDIIADKMKHAKPLPDLDKLPDYDDQKWKGKYSVNQWSGKTKRDWYPKWPYFSGRLGFRETEYTISAAQQSLTIGAGLEWPILTLTHELIHGYVRNILALLFEGDPNIKDDVNWSEFYENFANITEETGSAKNELESLRSIIFSYCCQSWTFGSLTTESNTEPQKIPGNLDKIRTKVSDNYYLLTKDDLFQQYENEFRNISEIMVHVLDFHYFYASNLSAYIPIIWRSWAEVPHVSADLRQYLLRSLLVVSTKIPGKPYGRFHNSASRLKEILKEHSTGVLDVSLVHEAIKYLDDKKRLNSLIYPFWASLILVDMTDKIFISRDIRGSLFSDPLVYWIEDEEGFEPQFEYRLPNGFSEEKIIRPAPYLLDRMLRQLKQPIPSNRLEAETARIFLACCSNVNE